MRVEGLTKVFTKKTGRFRRNIYRVHAVDDVSFTLWPGETLGLVGESGCGKTTTGRLILRLLDPTAGRVRMRQGNGWVDLTTLKGEALRQFRRHIQMVFQDPFSSLNPRMTAFDIVAEPLLSLSSLTREQISRRVHEVIQAVGLQMHHLIRYPHAFSGGQRQRIGIARALALDPQLLVCDEPVSALDVSVQAQVVNLLKTLQRERGLTYIFIAHDLAVVENISTRVAVMYAGRIVESAPTPALYGDPKHPYTASLLSSVPVPDPDAGLPRPLEGEVIDPANLPPGCAFAPRCAHADDRCRTERPTLRSLGDAGDQERLVACHHSERIELRVSASASRQGVAG